MMSKIILAALFASSAVVTEATTCGAGKKVLNSECVDCPAGKTNSRNDDVAQVNTLCVATICGNGYKVLKNACVKCEDGKTRSSSDDASGGDTLCVATMCGSGKKVSSHQCVSCPAGKTRTSNDDASAGDTYCVATRCGTGKKVLGNECVACPLGKTRTSNDDASGDDTTCASTTCGAGKKVIDHKCVDCPAGETSTSNDDAFGGNTVCVATICGTGSWVSSHTCVDCPAGKTSSSDDATGEDTTCVATTCGTNKRVSSHTCVDCPAGKTSSSGGDASGINTACKATRCGTNKRVSSNTCVACPAGKMSTSNDDASLGDTTCVAILCGTNMRVSQHSCVACTNHKTRPGNDDATAGDTQCEATHCTLEVPANGELGDCTSAQLASGLTCKPTCNSGYTKSVTASSAPVPGTVRCDYPGLGTVAGYPMIVTCQVATGMCSGNKDTAKNVDCNGGDGISTANTHNKGSMSKGNTKAQCCEAMPCELQKTDIPPTNGGIGDCPDTTLAGSYTLLMASGLTCQPTCNSGYTISGSSRCHEGTLSAAICKAVTGMCSGNGNDVGNVNCEDSSGANKANKHNKGSTVKGNTLEQCCEAPTCDATTAPANGVVGTCTTALALGSTCLPACNSGYTISGSYSCKDAYDPSIINSMPGHNAILTATATCQANPCTPTTPPANGTIGDCKATLASGLTCQPTCNAGYIISGSSSCAAGTLTTATCQAFNSTKSTEAVAAGATAMQVPSTVGFSVGMTVDIDLGTAVYEVNIIQAFGSLLFASPLKFAHPIGAAIAQAPVAPSPVLDQAIACGDAFAMADNNSKQCLKSAGLSSTADSLNMVCITCSTDFKTTLAAQNLAKGCTNASSTITEQTQFVLGNLTAACADASKALASKSFQSGKKAAIGLGIGGVVCSICLCALCIGIIMKCVGGKKTRGRNDYEEADEEDDDDDEDDIE